MAGIIANPAARPTAFTIHRPCCAISAPQVNIPDCMFLSKSRARLCYATICNDFSDLPRVAMSHDLHNLDDLHTALEQRDQALLQSRQNLQLAERVIDASLEG